MNNSNVEYTPRERLPLIPSSVAVSELPPKLSDGDRPLKVDEARNKYIQFERGAWGEEKRTSHYRTARTEHYPRILHADRWFQANYEGLTTAKLTRGLSPRDDSGEWLTAWELDEMLNGDARSRCQQRLNYDLTDKYNFDFNYVAVTTATQTTVTPREYIYLWIEDPEDEISIDHLLPALEKHLQNCENASAEKHPVQQSGSAGAITVRHDPPLVSHVPDKFFNIDKWSDVAGYPNTTGAQFVASSLPHLPVGNYANSNRENPSNRELEGGAIAWATGHNWFRSSGDLPESP